MYLMAKVNLSVGEPLPKYLPMGACKWLESLGVITSLEIWGNKGKTSVCELRAFNGSEEIGKYPNNGA